jgi:hypothetical protein
VDDVEVGRAVVARCGCREERSWRKCGSWDVVNVVCVVSGVRGPEVVPDVWGSGCTPSACAAGVCVKNANEASPFPAPSICFAGEFDDRGSRFGTLGCSRARNRAICASLRFFSATRASLSFLVSMSLRRSVKRASGVSLESFEGGWRFWTYLVSNLS